MTISTSNAQPAALPGAEALPAAELLAPPPAPPAPPSDAPAAAAELPHTVWSRFIILLLCLAVVMTTMAFGTVHAWALGLFQLSAAAVVVLWVLDAWRTGTLRVSRNLLQLPLLGLIAVGAAQLLLPGGGNTLTQDPHATRYALIQLSALFVYFAAALAFVDSPRRLRVVTRTVIIFGFLLALYGLMQHFVNPATIFFVREPKQAAPFGPYVNRHHFAGYMELTMALPLGLILAGAVERERILLYAFASAVMGIALVMTNSRGGMLSMLAEVFFLALVAARVRREGRVEGAAGGRVRALAARLGLGFVMVLAVFVGVLYFGGEEAVSRLLGTVNSEDPTTGRAHFWQATWRMIQDRPVLGAGLGAFSAVYPRYDTSNGLYRLEQAHNDYLQLLSDAGVVGFLLGVVFVVALVRVAVARMQSHDRVRRGVALGALAGCAGVLVHSFFDFTLHTTANALLFLLLAALATLNGRVEEPEARGRHRRRRRRAGAAERERLAA